MWSYWHVVCPTVLLLRQCVEHCQPLPKRKSLGCNIGHVKAAILRRSANLPQIVQVEYSHKIVAISSSRKPGTPCPTVQSRVSTLGHKLCCI